MIPVSEAIQRILAGISVLPSEDVDLPQARGRVLAESVDSPIDLPSRANSAMDGYAARAEDVRGASKTSPKTLRIIEEIAAGRVPARTVEPGTCARIFTGAPVPIGADSVIRQEDTERSGETVRVLDDRDASKNVRPAAEDLQNGRRVFDAGVTLHAAQIGVLAAMAMARIKVYRKARVAIMASGDEIADLDQRGAILRGEKIASSNTYALQAMVEDAGAIAVPLGIAPDEPGAVTAMLERGARAADLVLSTAGVSVGEHDYMHAALEALGATKDFWRVSMRPGSPLGFGIVRGTPWIGLPGNPVSALVCFELYARPAIRKMQGASALHRRTVKAVMAQAAKTPGRLTHFLRGNLRREGDVLKATLTGPQGSGILTSMAKADALLVIPAGRDAVLPGETVDAILLGDAQAFSEQQAEGY